jgi:hypothetical protein
MCNKNKYGKENDLEQDGTKIGTKVKTKVETSLSWTVIARGSCDRMPEYPEGAAIARQSEGQP